MKIYQNSFNPTLLVLITIFFLIYYSYNQSRKSYFKNLKGIVIVTGFKTTNRLNTCLALSQEETYGTSNKIGFQFGN